MNTRGPESMGLGADFFRIKPRDMAAEGVRSMRGVGEKALKGIGNLIGTKDGIQEVDGVPVMRIRDTAKAVLETVADMVGGQAEFLDEGSFRGEILDFAETVITGMPELMSEIRLMTAREVQGLMASVDDWIINNSEHDPNCDGSLVSDAISCLRHPVNTALYVFARDEAMKRKYPDPRRVFDSKVTPTTRRFNPLTILDRVVAHSGLGDSDIKPLFV